MIRRLLSALGRRVHRAVPDALTPELAARIDGRRSPRDIAAADLAEFARIVGASLPDLRRVDRDLADLYLTPDQEKP